MYSLGGAAGLVKSPGVLGPLGRAAPSEVSSKAASLFSIFERYLANGLVGHQVHGSISLPLRNRDLGFCIVEDASLSLFRAICARSGARALDLMPATPLATRSTRS